MEQDIGMQMRQGLRRLAKAVVIISTRHQGQRYAMAATAVSELSMWPPSMLICVNQSASIFPVLAAGAPFCINILHASQSSLSTVCSGAAKGEDRFAHGEWGETTLKIPRLLAAQASFVCLNESSIDYGTHAIFIGRVEEVFVDREVDPLVYVDGIYTRIGETVTGLDANARRS